MIKVITKMTTNNYQNSNKRKEKNNEISAMCPKIFILKTYQSYKSTDAQHIGNKSPNGAIVLSVLLQ